MTKNGVSPRGVSPQGGKSISFRLVGEDSGVLAALYGVPLNQPAAIGLLRLIGLVVNNGIVMIEHINMYRRRGIPRHVAMIRGGR